MELEINVFADQGEAEIKRQNHVNNGKQARIETRQGVQIYDHRNDPQAPAPLLIDPGTVYVVYAE